MDAEARVKGWMRRLQAADPSTLVFAGYEEAEIAACEQRLGVTFPAVYRAWLRAMGKEGEMLFGGSDVTGLERIEADRALAHELMAETDPSLRLPEDAIPFLNHQGYIVEFIRAQGGEDGPTWGYVEGEPQPERAYDSFGGRAEYELELLESLVHRHRVHEEPPFQPDRRWWESKPKQATDVTRSRRVLDDPGYMHGEVDQVPESVKPLLAYGVMIGLAFAILIPSLFIKSGEHGKAWMIILVEVGLAVWLGVLVRRANDKARTAAAAREERRRKREARKTMR